MIELLMPRIKESEVFWLKQVRETAASAIDCLEPEQTSYTKVDIDFEKEIVNQKKPEIKIVKSGDQAEIRDIMECTYDEWKQFHDNPLIRHDEDYFTALNQAVFDSGSFILVRAGKETRVERKIINTGSGFMRNRIFVEKGARFALTDSFISSPGSSLFSCSTEIFLAEDSCFTYNCINSLDRSTKALLNSKARLMSGSRINWNILSLGSGLMKEKRETQLAGHGASVNEVEIMLGEGTQHMDLSTNTVHAAPRTESRILVKGVLAGNARQVAYGNVTILGNAPGTNSFLAEHSILLSKGAKADSIPALEILTNDVVAKHAATCTQLDDEKLFYLTSRGLDVDDAKRLVVSGFLNSAISLMHGRDEMMRTEAEKWLQGLSC